MMYGVFRHPISNEVCHPSLKRFDPKLNDLNVEHYQFKIWNRFAVLENMDDKMPISMIWECSRENTKISTKESLGYYELRVAQIMV
jgi:hypothetical protein